MCVDLEIATHSENHSGMWRDGDILFPSVQEEGYHHHSLKLMREGVAGVGVVRPGSSWLSLTDSDKLGHFLFP